MELCLTDVWFNNTRTGSATLVSISTPPINDTKIPNPKMCIKVRN